MEENYSGLKKDHHEKKRSPHFSLPSDWSKRPWREENREFCEKVDRRRKLNIKVADQPKGEKKIIQTESLYLFL